jgi:hypothetical protein
MAYRMLLQPNVGMRLQRWKAFIAEARSVDAGVVEDSEVTSFQCLIAMIWRRVKWSNNRKVLYWQISVNGLPTSASRHTGGSCYCDKAGHDCPDRKHHLWDCPVAAAVVLEMCRCLGIPQLQRHQVWLMILPEQMLPTQNGAISGSVRRALHEVWIVVCLAALQAMWITAKKIMGQTTRASLMAQPRGLHEVVVDSAVVQFWELVQEFATYSKVTGSWRRLLPPDCPFLHFPSVAGRLQLNKAAR